MKTIVFSAVRGGYIEFDTDEYAALGIDEETACKLAMIECFPETIRGLMATSIIEDKKMVLTRWGYMPSSRQKSLIPKPKRRKKAKAKRND